MQDFEQCAFGLAPPGQTRLLAPSSQIAFAEDQQDFGHIVAAGNIARRQPCRIAIGQNGFGQARCAASEALRAR